MYRDEQKMIKWMELILEHFYIFFFMGHCVLICHCLLFSKITQFSDDILVKTNVNSTANAYLVRRVYRDIEDYIFFILLLKIGKLESFSQLVVSYTQKLW